MNFNHMFHLLEHALTQLLANEKEKHLNNTISGKFENPADRGNNDW